MPHDEKDNPSNNPLRNHDLDQFIAKHSDSIEGKIWRGAHAKSQKNNSTRSICTGYKSINEQLHSNGWPLKTTTELGISQHGIGELRLLMPALKELQKSQQQKEVILIAPPYTPYAPALHQYGIDVSRLTVVKAHTLNERLWATEQSLVADCCAAVISWYGNFKISHSELRRLQLASERTNSWNVLFRHNNCLEDSSAAGLRIHLNSTAYSKLQLDIIKQPNGWGGQRCVVSLLPHYENWQRIATQLLPTNQELYKPIENEGISSKQENAQRTMPHNSNARKKAAETKTTIENTIERPQIWHCKVSVISAISDIRNVH